MQGVHLACCSFYRHPANERPSRPWEGVGIDPESKLIFRSLSQSDIIHLNPDNAIYLHSLIFCVSWTYVVLYVTFIVSFCSIGKSKNSKLTFNEILNFGRLLGPIMLKLVPSRWMHYRDLRQHLPVVVSGHVKLAIFHWLSIVFFVQIAYSSSSSVAKAIRELMTYELLQVHV